MASRVPSASSGPDFTKMYNPTERLENGSCGFTELLFCAFGASLFMDTTKTSDKVKCVVLTTGFGAAIGGYAAGPGGAGVGAGVGCTVSITKVAIDEYVRNKKRKCQLQKYV